HSGNSPIARGNTTLWREKPGSDRFLLRFPDGVRGCRLGPDGLTRGKVITEHDALGNLPPPGKQSEQVVWDGAKLVTPVDGREVYRYVPPTPTTYLAPPPLVADLAGKRRIVVRDAAGNYLLCSAAGKKERVFLERSYEVPEVLFDPLGAGPLVCDV